MEDLIQLYLFKNKRCPLPSLGTLTISDGNGVNQFTNGKIDAPLSAIQLQNDAMPADDFIDFIALKKNINKDVASGVLSEYCAKLCNIEAAGEVNLPYAGKFHVNAEGAIVFQSLAMPKEFFPEISVERVLHPDVSHKMVVGDKETTSTKMEAYYSKKELGRRNKWWLWASGLAVITVILLVFYQKDHGISNSFGNIKPIKPSPEVITYNIVEYR